MAIKFYSEEEKNEFQESAKYLCDICHFYDGSRCKDCILNPENQPEKMICDNCEDCIVTQINENHSDLSPEEWQMSEDLANATFAICNRCDGDR